MQKELDYMIERFPKYRGRLTELFNSSEDFKSLCNDYWECNYHILGMMSCRTNEPRIENGYKMLSLSLEQEVLRYLGD